jgi:hypothetical protein
MSGRHWTQSEYALEKVVESFGDLLFQLDHVRLTHTYQVVFRFCQLESIDYLELRYLNTGAQPFEEWADEWLHHGEALSSYILETVSGGDLISVALGQVSQEVEP